MAGHSKWSTIKRKKGAADTKRSKLFSKANKDITIAVKEGGSADPEFNPALRAAIANAKGVNMPKDNIERAIKKAAGADSGTYNKVTFEGYGPNGVAFFVECATDNLNRTVSDIRAIFSKNGGALGKNGSVEFLFERKGEFTIETEKISQDTEELEFELIESGLDSMEVEEGFITIYTEYSDFGTMSDALDKMGIEVKNSGLVRIPLNTTVLPLEEAKKILALEEKFEDNDDVQNVFHTLELTDELMEAME